MIHPKTELRLINNQVGYGVFAIDFIPEGTITYVKDSLELVITPTDYLIHSAEMQQSIEKYSYRDENRESNYLFSAYSIHNFCYFLIFFCYSIAFSYNL